eukprot:3299594-Rhodomonas_salina.1
MERFPPSDGALPSLLPSAPNLMAWMVVQAPRDLKRLLLLKVNSLSDRVSELCTKFPNVNPAQSAQALVHMEYQPYASSAQTTSSSCS